jgi:FkbM family methyltransferase
VNVEQIKNVMLEAKPIAKPARKIVSALLWLFFAPLPNQMLVRRRGVKYLLDTTDDIQRLIFLNVYESAELQILSALLQPGCCCFDVGANIGFFSLHMAKIVGSFGKVFAFEPDEDNLARLRRNVLLNDFAKVVTISPLALGAKRGLDTFHKSARGHSGWGSLAKYGDLETVAVTVATDTLDDFCAEHCIRKIDFLKVDIEGFEFEFLRGASRVLQGNMVRNILVEFNGPRLAERGRTLQEMIAYFDSLGYVAGGRPTQSPSNSKNVVENLLFSTSGHDV